MSTGNSQASKILRIGVIYFVLAWVVVKVVSLATLFFGVPNWVLNWLEVSAYTVFPVIFLVLYLKNRHDNKKTSDPITHRKEKANPIQSSESQKSLAILPLNRAMIRH